ncbi:MAG: TetR/AcrR family transcriptional regulator [Acidobacteria bacterium]|nr:TetR/AcrR family transcriptional regulator [Acidobacteriota bacterium]
MPAGEQHATRGRALQGERTRAAILRVAVDLASIEGLEGLTIGRLSTELAMSKSGLFAHFGSKEELQLATIEAARAIFIEEVVQPALEASERGLPRIWELCERWTEYAQRGVFKGGCFFAAASSEFDGRPGPVRDRIAGIMLEWLAALERGVREAQDSGHLDPKADAKQVAFEFNALVMAGNWAFQLYGDLKAFTRAREAIRDRLRSIATTGAPPMAALGISRRKSSSEKIARASAGE